jgi:hypothetical protein
MNTVRRQFLTFVLYGALPTCFASASAWAQNSQEGNTRYHEEPTSLKLQALPDDQEAAEVDGGGDVELAEKLSNPVADLISVPFQMNFRLGGGVDIPERSPNLRLLPRPIARYANRVLREDRDQAFGFLMNVQPVIPFSLTED